MTANEATEFINSVLSKIDTITKFEAYETKIPGYRTPTIHNPILIEISGTIGGEIAYGLTVIHPERELDRPTKRTIGAGVAITAAEIIKQLDLQLGYKRSAAAKNN